MATLYRHFDSSGTLLYVGVSLNAVKRLGQHQNGSSWFPSVASIAVETFETKEQALLAERIAIQNENPKFNVTRLPQRSNFEQADSMTSKQYRAALEALDLSQGEAAEWMGISIRTSHSYANGEPIPETVAKLLRLTIKMGLKPEDVK